MKPGLSVRIGATIAVLTVAASVAPVVLAQMAPPTESKGVSAKVIGALPLAPEIDSIENRQLRMRMITLAPGGVFAVHNHKDRPSVEFILKGTATEYSGDTSKTYRDGESLLANKETEHWWRNDGTEPAIFVTVDVFNPPK